MTALSFVFAFVLMLGVLIFVHELGHFLVAKWFDVKVVRFSLGFGPPIGIGRWKLAFRRGETEYVAAWFPLGGYVKMVGENPQDGQEVPGEELLAPGEEQRAFDRKPVWQRLLILFAGPGMNLLLPVLVFVGVLAVGMPRQAPVIGTVEPASPAEQVGLRVGDRVLAIDGEPVRWWDDVEDAIRARAGAIVPVRVERAGEILEFSLPIETRTGLDAYGSSAQVGFAGLAHARLAAVVGIVEEDAPAAATALRSGDVVRSVDGEPVEDWSQFAARYAAAAGSEVLLSVERVGAEPGATPLRAEVRVPALGGVEALGVVPATVLVAQVSPDSPAERAGLAAGDLIVAVDGRPVGSFASFSELVRASEGRPLEIVYARGGERREVQIRPERKEADTGLGIPEERWLIGITSQVAAVPGAMATEQVRNPLQSVPRAVAMTADLTRTFLGGFARIVTGEVSRRQLAGPIGIAQIAHKAFESGWQTYLSTLVLISINLAILNLLPIPVLDGGQALLIAVEGIKRSPLSLRTREIVQQVGVTFLLMLMALAFWNDLSRHWRTFLDWLRQSAGL
jgi:regulator of sigma E protease